jgi:hypothetical protein
VVVLTAWESAAVHEGDQFKRRASNQEETPKQVGHFFQFLAEFG